MANWKILFLLLAYVKSQTLTVNRNSKGDTLKCDTSVRCLELNAQQINKSSCLCLNSGTILTANIRCSLNGGCKFYINPLKNIYTIPYKQNLNAILKSDYYLKSEKINSVQVLNQNMEWIYLDSHGFILLRNGTLMLINYRNIRTGELLKINLSYKTNNDQSDESCVMIKVEGALDWKNSDLAKPICGATEINAYTTTSVIQTEKPTLFYTKTSLTTSMSKTQVRTVKPTPDPKDKTTQTKTGSFTSNKQVDLTSTTPSMHIKAASKSKMIVLIVTIVTAFAIILFAAVCIGFRVKRRRPKHPLQKSSEPDIRVESIYDSADGYTAFQNQAYLSSVPLNEQNKLKTEKKPNIEREKKPNVDESEYSTLFQANLPKNRVNEEYVSLQRDSLNYSALNVDQNTSSYASLDQSEYQCIN